MNRNWRIRPVKDQDFADITDTMCTVEPEPVAEDETRDWHRSATGDRECPVEWFAAVDGEGDGDVTFLGWGYCGRAHWLPRDEFEIGLAVSPAHRGKGVGTYLLEFIEARARQGGGKTAHAWVHGEHPDSLNWALRCGYEIERQRAQSVLDLSKFDASRFQVDLERVTAEGIEIVALWDKEIEPYLPGQYEVEVQTFRDVPFHSPESTHQTYDDWLRWYRETSSRMLSVLALHGGKVVGYTGLTLSQIEGQSAWIGYTAVLRPYRGKGIAFALKVTAAVEAARAGIPSIRTNNDQDNPAILHLNNKMGFRREPGPVIVKKSLA